MTDQPPIDLEKALRLTDVPECGMAPYVLLESWNQLADASMVLRREYLAARKEVEELKVSLDKTKQLYYTKDDELAAARKEVEELRETLDAQTLEAVATGERLLDDLAAARERIAELEKAGRAAVEEDLRRYMKSVMGGIISPRTPATDKTEE